MTALDSSVNGGAALRSGDLMQAIRTGSPNPGRVLAVNLGLFALAWGCVALTRQSCGIASIWFANALLLGVLLRARFRAWPAYVLTGFVTYVAANLVSGNSLAASAAMSACNFVEIGVVAYILRRRWGSALDLTESRALVEFCLFGGLVGPAVSASITAFGFWWFNNDGFFGVWRVWFSSDALGTLTLAPLLLEFQRDKLNQLFDPARRCVACLILVVVLAAAVIGFGQVEYDVEFLVFPALLLAAFTLGLTGAVLAAFLTVAAAIGLTLSGHGPFVPVDAETAANRIMVLQLLLACAVLMTLPVAAVLTARDRLQQHWQMSSAQAERASRAKSQFMASMSHELRTPLNAVIGFAELLFLRRESLAGKQSEYVEYILRGGNQLLELVNEVLDFAKIEAGSLHVAVEPIDTAALLDEFTALLKPMAEARQLEFSVAAPARLPTISADRTRLMQILMNLGSNAVKYNRDGGSVAVTVATPPGQWLRIEIADTGIGIAPKRHAEVFEPFNRLGAEAGPIEGAGLGLSICKRLIELMQGRIGFASEPGAGTRFWVDVRLAQGGEIAEFGG